MSTPLNCGGSGSIEQDRSVVWAFTATPKAVERFKEALVYAEAAVHGKAEDLKMRDGTSARAQTAREHGEWLRWGLRRILNEGRSR